MLNLMRILVCVANMLVCPMQDYPWSGIARLGSQYCLCLHTHRGSSIAGISTRLKHRQSPPFQTHLCKQGGASTRLTAADRRLHDACMRFLQERKKQDSKSINQGQYNVCVHWVYSLAHPFIKLFNATLPLDSKRPIGRKPLNEPEPDPRTNLFQLLNHIAAVALHWRSLVHKDHRR